MSRVVAILSNFCITTVIIDNTFEAEIIAEFEGQRIVYRKKNTPFWAEDTFNLFN
jgi:hypothetical protein